MALSSMPNSACRSTPSAGNKLTAYEAVRSFSQNSSPLRGRAHMQAVKGPRRSLTRWTRLSGFTHLPLMKCLREQGQSNRLSRRRRIITKEENDTR